MNISFQICLKQKFALSDIFFILVLTDAIPMSHPVYMYVLPIDKDFRDGETSTYFWRLVDCEEFLSFYFISILGSLSSALVVKLCICIFPISGFDIFFVINIVIYLYTYLPGLYIFFLFQNPC